MTDSRASTAPARRRTRAADAVFSLAAAVAVSAFFVAPRALAEEYRPSELKPGVHLGAERGQELVLDADAPRVRFDEHAFRRIELLFGELRPVPDFRRAVMELELETAPDTPIQNVHIRLRDGGGETIDWVAVTPEIDGRVRTYRFELSDATIFSRWGGQANGALDFPLRLHDVCVTLAPGAAGEIAFRRLVFRRPEGEPLTVRRAMHDFSDRDLWRIMDPKRSHFFYVDEFGGARVTRRDDDTLDLEMDGEGYFVLREIAAHMMEYHDPVAFILDVETLAGRGVAKPAFRSHVDRQRLRPDPREQPLGPGRRKIRFDLSKAEPAQRANLWLWGMEFAVRSPEGAKLRLHGMELEYSASPAEAIAFSIDTGNDINVLAAGSEQTLAFRLHNEGDRPVSGEFEATLRDINGRRLEHRRRFALAAGESLAWNPELDLPAQGVWRVDHLVRAENNEHRGKASFAWMTPAGPTTERNPEFQFGVCSHTPLASPRDGEREALAAALCGIKVFRASTVWMTVEPVQGQWDFRIADRVLSAFERHGILQSYTLSATPDWAAVNGGVWTSLPRADYWRDYVRVMAERYRGRLHSWEVWNEPDLTGFARFEAEDYVNLLKIAYAELKAVDPGTPVMIGGFSTLSGSQGPRPAAFQRQALVDGQGHFDIHAYHEHGSFGDYALLVDSRFLPLRRETGTDVPWFSNETAITSAGGGDREQATTLFKKLVFAWSRGAIGFSWYDLRNDGFNPNEGEHNYGMITRDFQPKFVYGVYNALARQLGAARFEDDLGAAAGVWLFRFRDGDRRIHAAWNRNADAERKVLAFAGPAATAVDLMGNETPLVADKGLVLWEVGADPGFLVLPDGGEGRAPAVLAEWELPAVAVRGRELPGVLKLNNPGAQPLELRLDWRLRGLSAAIALPESVTLSGGELRRVAVPLSLPEEPVDAAPSAAVAVGLGGHERLCVGAVRLATHIPSAGRPDRPADFNLDRLEHVHNSFANDPSRAHMLWRGPGDLSARIHLSEEADAFVVRAEVQDDVHLQSQANAKDIWRQDCLQFRLAFPGQRGVWEIGLALGEDGAAKSFVWYAPQEHSAEDVNARLALKARREGERTHYEIAVPLAALGIERSALRRGFRFNLIVNDDDGQGRKGWVQIAPGIGGNKDTEKYPYVVVAE